MIYLSKSNKYNAPKHFEMLRGKTSVWVSVIIQGAVVLSDHTSPFSQVTEILLPSLTAVTLPL